MCSLTICGNLSARDSFAIMRTATGIGDRPPTRPYVAWPLVGQIAATVGLTVLEQAGMAMWDQLKALDLVEYGDQFIVKDILAAD
jgi:hypothetical protein